MDLSAGKIEYIDIEKHKPEMLVSETHRLRGRPDYILFKEGEYIPVEVKTGRTPQGPLFSHILQLATYCILLEETYGKGTAQTVLNLEGGSSLHVTILKWLLPLAQQSYRGMVLDILPTP